MLVVRPMASSLLRGDMLGIDGGFGGPADLGLEGENVSERRDTCECHYLHEGIRCPPSPCTLGETLDP